MKRLMGIAAATLLSASAASAGTFNFTSNSSASTEGLGSYTGSMDYDAGSAVLTIVLNNTTSGYTQAKITGFVFNIDGSANATFIDLDDAGTSGFNESAFDGLSSPSASPFGDFEEGAALGGDFLGGGSPNAGIDIGESGIFRFNIAGVDSNTDFWSLNGGLADWEFVVRFRGIEPGDLSDKVPGTPVIPLPPAAFVGAAMLGGMGLNRARKSIRRFFA